MERLSGRVALLSGASGGLGKAIAERLVSEGASMVLTDVADDAGQEFATELADAGARVIYVHLDVTVEDDWNRAIEAARSQFGQLDILVNNAGIAEGLSIDDVSLEQWNRTVAVDQTGVFLGLKCAGPLLAESPSASAVNISSILGASGGVGLFPAYHAAKGAVRILTKNVALAWAERGIRVNSIHPGFLNARVSEAAHDPSSYERMVAMTPLGRLGRPEEVAAGVAYLASDDASFVTGSELYIDGGFMAQ